MACWCVVVVVCRVSCVCVVLAMGGWTVVCGGLVVGVVGGGDGGRGCG